MARKQQRPGVLQERYSCQEAAVAASGSAAGTLQLPGSSTCSALGCCRSVAVARKQQVQQQCMEQLQELERYVAGALGRHEFCKVLAELFQICCAVVADLLQSACSVFAGLVTRQESLEL